MDAIGFSKNNIKENIEREREGVEVVIVPFLSVHPEGGNPLLSLVGPLFFLTCLSPPL
jgi:hypothetical protein